MKIKFQGYLLVQGGYNHLSVVEQKLFEYTNCETVFSNEFLKIWELFFFSMIATMLPVS